MAPKELNAEVVKLLNGHVNEILKMPDVVARMTTLALVPVGGADTVSARSEMSVAAITQVSTPAGAAYEVPHSSIMTGIAKGRSSQSAGAPHCHCCIRKSPSASSAANGECHTPRRHTMPCVR